MRGHRFTIAGFGKFCPKTGAWYFALVASFSEFLLPRLSKLWIIYQVSKVLKSKQNCTYMGKIWSFSFGAIIFKTGHSAVNPYKTYASVTPRPLRRPCLRYFCPKVMDRKHFRHIHRAVEGTTDVSKKGSKFKSLVQILKNPVSEKNWQYLS